MDLLIKPVRSVVLFALLAAVPTYSFSQDSTWVSTTQLDEVVVYGLKSLEFIKGSNQQHFDSSLKENPAENVANLLQRNSAVYIKEYGNQMLSTISLRGTGAGHTSTRWNGMNISSPTLGQFDFSQAPSIVTDELLVHFGGSSSLFGNESIGGTVIMQSQSQWNDDPTMMFYQDIGSFGSYNSRGVFRFNTDRFESATKAYFSVSENDYPYTNILLPETPEETQKNSRVQQEGFAQDLYWRPKPGKEISLHSWYHHSNRQIQSSMANPNAEDTQEDRNLRIQSVWKKAAKAGYLNAKLGFVHDYMLYNKSIATKSDQFLLQTDLGKDIGKKLKANVGGSFNHIIVETDNYSENVSENRWDIYAWLKYNPSRVWSLSANIRSAGATGFVAPVSPSLGWDLTLKQNPTTKITWQALGGFNYRIPTLNDRFWEPGGNPELRPETSLSTETGFKFDKIKSLSSYQASITVYSMWIDDWIIWLPQGSFWSPQNLKEVHSSGLEASAEGIYVLGKIDASWSASYSYTKSTNQTQLDPYDRSEGKQLPYVPFHSLSLALKLKSPLWDISISGNYTGERFTSTDNEDSLEDFWLLDLRTGRSFKNFAFDFRILNLLNTTYYHLPLRPMPGRNYRLGFTINI